MTEKITYYINTDCINCGLCVKVCPEHCIDVYKKPALSIRINAGIAVHVLRSVLQEQSETGMNKNQKFSIYLITFSVVAF